MARQKSEVAPGPTTISAEEAALGSDPGAAGSHAIILLEEADIDERQVTEREMRYHLRAKILTNEGRGLADIEIPYVQGTGKIREWWARTLLPGGGILDLPLEKVEARTLLKAGGFEYKVLRAALPGVVPGAVIDYGFQLRSGFLPYDRIGLQRDYPVRKVRLRWHPAQGFNGAYRLYSAGLPITARTEEDAVHLAGDDLPPLVEEPWMPPRAYAQAAITLYYVPFGNPLTFWKDVGHAEEGALAAFLRRDKILRQNVEHWKLSPDQSLEDKLAYAYRWTAEHVKDREHLSFEEQHAFNPESAEPSASDRLDQILRRGEGSEREISRLYVGLARILGAEAHLVLATDRRFVVWDKDLLSPAPFEHLLVAVRPPGTGDDAIVLLDPGSGLEYGQVPWWLTGVNALLAGKEGGRPIFVPPADAEKNASETTGQVLFEEDGTLRATWTRTSANARGFDERRALKQLDPHARGERLRELCRGREEFEVSSAATPGLADPFGPLRLECTLEGAFAGPPEGAPRFPFVADGPWIDPLPDFEGRTTRAHPVIFGYGRVDRDTLQVKAPPGFLAAPGELPPQRFETAFGTYVRTVEATPDGYRVQREVMFTPLKVPAADYPLLLHFLEDVRRADRVPLLFERRP